MFQAGQADKSDRLMKTVVRKNPNYAGEKPCHLSHPGLAEYIEYFTSRSTLSLAACTIAC